MTRRTRSKRKKSEWSSLSFPHISVLSLSWTLAVFPTHTNLHLASPGQILFLPFSLICTFPLLGSYYLLRLSSSHNLTPSPLILPPKPNSHPSLSHLLPPTATLSSLSPGYLPPSFAFFISFAFLFISLSPSHCSLFLYLLLFPFLFPFSLLLMSHYPSHYSLRSFYFRSSSRIIPLSALSTLLLLLTFPSLRYVYALLLHLSSLLFHYSPALKFFYSYASLLIFSHSLLPLLSSTLQLLLYSPSLCLFTSLLLLPFPFLFSYYILFLKVSLLFLSHSPVPMARRVGGREGGGREGEAGRERGSR